MPENNDDSLLLYLRIQSNVLVKYSGSFLGEGNFKYNACMHMQLGEVLDNKIFKKSNE